MIYFNLFRNLNFDKIKNLIPQLNLPSEFTEQLDCLITQLPTSEESEENINKWLKNNFQKWKEEYRNLLIKYRNIGHKWNFNEQQKELLQQ